MIRGGLTVELWARMSLSAVSSPSRLTEGLTPTKIKELVSLILKSEHPHTSREVLEPLLELVSSSRTIVIGMCSNLAFLDYKSAYIQYFSSL